MTDEDTTNQYESQIASFRDATRWIISLFAGLAAFIVAGSSLNGIGALPLGYRLFGAIGASVFALACIAGIIFAAVRVMIFKGIGLADLDDEKKTKYNTHRTFIEKQLLPYTNFATIKNLKTAYDGARKKASEGDSQADSEEIALRKYVMIALAMAKMISVQRAFESLKWTLIGLMLPLLMALYVSVWFANPAKDIGEAMSPPRVQPLALTPDARAKLLAGGLRDACLKSPFLLIFVKMKPAGLSEAYTVPQLADCQSLKLLIHGETEIVRVE